MKFELDTVGDVTKHVVHGKNAVVSAREPSGRTKRSLDLIASTMAFVSACGADLDDRASQSPAEATVTHEGQDLRILPVRPQPLPQGLVCGLSYAEATDVFTFSFGSPGVKTSFTTDFQGDVAWSDPKPAGAPSISVGNQSQHFAWSGSCMGMSTMTCGPFPVLAGTVTPTSWHCVPGLGGPATGYHLSRAVDTGDAYSSWINGSPIAGGTAPGLWGFSYQGFVGSDTQPVAGRTAVSDQFALPKGTACGLAHTELNPTHPTNWPAAPTCMGYNPLDPDPAQRCPAGWASRYMFDQSSGNGRQNCALGLGTQPDCGFWAWCEYQDPNNRCDASCQAFNTANGVATNLFSNTDASGVPTCGAAGMDHCPCYGGVRSSSFDQGRGSGQGLGWCGAIAQQSDDQEPFWPSPQASCSASPQACGPYRSNAGFTFCQKRCEPAPIPGTYLGCWQDNGNRALPAFLGTSYTIEQCVQTAQQAGYRYAGLQWFNECWAGSTPPWARGYAQLPDSSCSTPCDGNTDEKCGGGWANSVYEVANPIVQKAYMGCFYDNGNRALPYELDTDGAATVDSCADAAAAGGFDYAGLQYYGQCFAGYASPAALGYPELDESSCNTPCSANPDQICGGVWANSVYQIWR